MIVNLSDLMDDKVAGLQGQITANATNVATNTAAITALGNTKLTGVATSSVIAGDTKWAKIAIGPSAAAALVSGTIGNDVVAIGSQPALVVTSGRCIAIGSDALSMTATGNGNTAIGYQSNMNCTTAGNHNVTVGDQAAWKSTTASGMVAVGHSALRLNTTGNQNCAVGGDSMQSNLTGGFNTALGGDSLSQTVAASNNVALGYSAMAWSLGDDNVAVGHRAFAGTTSGGSNTGTANVAAGYRALYAPGATTANATTSGSRQVGIGAESGQASATQRVDAVAVGYRALFDGNNTVALGSGAQALHAGSVALGQGSVTTSVNQVMVGARDIEITDTTKGVVLKSPDGTRYRIQVANGGAVSAVAA